MIRANALLFTLTALFGYYYSDASQLCVTYKITGFNVVETTLSNQSCVQSQSIVVNSYNVSWCNGNYSYIVFTLFARRDGDKFTAYANGTVASGEFAGESATLYYKLVDPTNGCSLGSGVSSICGKVYLQIGDPSDLSPQNQWRVCMGPTILSFNPAITLTPVASTSVRNIKTFDCCYGSC